MIALFLYYYTLIIGHENLLQDFETFMGKTKRRIVDPFKHFWPEVLEMTANRVLKTIWLRKYVFWPRAKVKGPNWIFVAVVVVVVLGVQSSSKNVPRATKNVRELFLIQKRITRSKFVLNQTKNVSKGTKNISKWKLLQNKQKIAKREQKMPTISK